MWHLSVPPVAVVIGSIYLKHLEVSQKDAFKTCMIPVFMSLATFPWLGECNFVLLSPCDLQAEWLWAPQGFRTPTGRTWRSWTAWRSPSATSSTSSRTSTRPGSPSPPSWTWTLRSPWRLCPTAPSPPWRSCTRPPTPSPAPSAPLNHHQQRFSQRVSYYWDLFTVGWSCRIWVQIANSQWVQLELQAWGRLTKWFT